MNLNTQELFTLVLVVLCAQTRQESVKPCLVCTEILANMANGNMPDMTYECKCIVKDLRETNAQLLSTVSDLEAQVTNLTTQLNITEGLLAEVTEQLENICPNTSALQAACDADPNFNFIRTDDGCTAMCYYVNTDSMTQAAAQQACVAVGGTIAKLDTMERNALVMSAVRTTYRSKSLWIGLSQQAGAWTWMPSGDPVTFSDWANDEPDNTNQFCAYLNEKAQHRWFDRACSYKAGALCELVV